METVEAAHAHLQSVMLPRLLHGVQLSDDPAAISASLQSAIATAAPCATVTTPSETSLVVDFPDDGSCTMGPRHRALHGTMTMDISVDGDPRIDGTFSLFGDGTLELDGTTSLTLVDGAQVGESSVDLQRGDHTRTMTSSWTEEHVQDLDGLDGWSLNGTRTIESCLGTREQTLTDLFVVDGEVVPSAGTITGDGPGGGSMTRTFERIDDETIDITVVIEAGDKDAIQAARQQCASEFGGAGDLGGPRPHRAHRGRLGKHRRPPAGDGQHTIAVTPDGELIGPVD